jgi:hypothetical protein
MMVGWTASLSILQDIRTKGQGGEENSICNHLVLKANNGGRNGRANSNEERT